MQTIAAILDIAKSVLCTVESTVTVCEAVAQMSLLDVNALLVVDGDSRVLGIFTEHDVLMEVVAADLNPSIVTVGEVMRNGVDAVSPRTSLEAALALMSECCREQLLVMEGGEVCGIVSLADIARLMVTDRDALINDLTYYITH